jgi:SAM-dependent methyltransferase
MLHTAIRHVTDEQWHDMLRRSVSSPEVDGIRLPGFPPTHVQEGTVNAAGVNAIDEANGFYLDVRGHADSLGAPVNPLSRLLDFGCGWGRILRFFVRDIPDEQLVGADIRPAFVDYCVKTGVPGNFSVIDVAGRLPYGDGEFTHIVSYSVFTHLPWETAEHRLAELARVAAPGCLFFLTVRPPRLLDHIAHGTEAKNDRERVLFEFAGEARAQLQRLPETGYAYLATNPDTKSTYGTAVYTEDFIRKNWAKHFSLVSYLAEPSRMWQAFAVMRRR